MKTAARQRGTALLLLVLLIVSASTFIFLKKLNQQSQQSYREEVTAVSLARAKEALIGYAAAYVELVSPSNPATGPGYLPCPDRNNDGQLLVADGEGSCSQGGGTSLGRLPWKYLGLSDLRDSAGERLWYAVSDNYRYNPQTRPLNSETPGTLTVDGNSDIVAVIIAPGPALAGQDRSTGPNSAANYLEGTNTNVTNGIFTATPSDTMNDRIVAITRQELMAAVEKRVLNQVATTLKTYMNWTLPGAPGRGIWLAPYADPKAFTPNLSSTATSGSNGLQLQDSAVDFTGWGVAVGDVVRDLTDGSIGTVTAPPAAHSLNVGSLQGGTANGFSVNDTYQILVKGLPALLRGTANGGTSNLTLKDSTKKFTTIGVAIGDVVEDRTDGSAGVINSVNSTQITVQNLTGGTNNRFTTGDRYQIRSAFGTVTATSPGSLTDSGIDGKVFDSSTRGLQIAANDIVENLSAGSIATITSVTGVSTLAVSTMPNVNNTYRIPRYNGSPLNTVSEGLLPYHEVGEPFRTGFAFNWTLNHSANIIVAGPAASPAPLVYSTYVTNFAQSSAVSGAITSAITDGAYCYWTQQNEADCHGTYNTSFIIGTATPGSSGLTLKDTTKTFQDWGVRPGDRIKITSEGANSIGIVGAISGNTVTALLLENGTGNNQFDPNENYKIDVPTQLTLGNVLLASPPTTITSTGTITAAVNDVIENVSDGSYALITGVDSTTFPGTTIITHEPLQGGTTNVFNPTGDPFRIRSGWVDHRTYGFNYRHRGTLTVNTNAGERVRNLVTTAPSQIVQNSTTPVIRIRDYDASNNLLADKDAFNNTDGNTVTVTLTGQPSTAVDAAASMQTSNIRYELREDPTELPTWFTANRWQRLVYVAIASGFAPNGAGTCTVNSLPLGTVTPSNCLGLRDTTDAGNVKERGDVQALVIAAGMPLNAKTPPDDRTQSGIGSYLDNGNASVGDHIFEKQTIGTSTFNDQIRVVAP